MGTDISQVLQIHDHGIPHRRRPLMIDSDIKREKKRKRVRFSDEADEEIGVKPIKKIKVDKSASSSKLGTERMAPKPIIKAKGSSQASQPELEEKSDEKQGTVKRRGYLRTYAKRRQRLTTRSGGPPTPNYTVEEVGSSQQEPTDRTTSTMPPYVPASLIAVRRPDREDA
ncbi:hypothetical protein PG985_007533 [Apiospora marii]|uniref:uncharacterized protein n=1 Tax=Apiospora marii TaxID=335849 RepID=UPI00313039C8